jgi:hypothetical protein
MRQLSDEEQDYYLERYPEVFQLLGGFFHQDAGYIPGNEDIRQEYDEIIEEYIEHRGSEETLRQVVSELDLFLKEVEHESEDTIDTILVYAFCTSDIDNMLRYLNTDKPSDVLKDMKQRLEDALSQKEQLK